MIRKILLLLPLSFLVMIPLNAQEEVTKKSEKQEADTTMVISKNRIVYQGRIYRQNASYLTFGYGLGYGFESRLREQNMTLSYHHFIKGLGLAVGYHASSDLPAWWRSYQKLNDFYLQVGKRWDPSPHWNFAVFGGPSYAYGWYIAWNEIYQEDRAFSFKTAGLYCNAEVTYRPLYDVGIGLSVYGSVNQYYSTVGAQIHLFFSTAFVRNFD
jgi:hypothetical protein